MTTFAMIVDDSSPGWNLGYNHIGGGHVLKFGYRWQKFGVILTFIFGVASGVHFLASIDPIATRMANGVTGVGLGARLSCILYVAGGVSLRFGVLREDLLEIAKQELVNKLEGGGYEVEVEDIRKNKPAKKSRKDLN